MSYEVLKAFGIVTNDSGCKFVESDKLADMLNSDDDLSEVGHSYKEGDEFLLGDYCSDLVETLVSNKYIKPRG